MSPLQSPGGPSVTVSIVSHRQWALVRPLLEQLGRLCRASVARIVVTINLPEPIEDLDVGIPLEIVHNPAPKGFGANHNAAFARCTTPWYLVLNPDIRLTSDVVGAMVARAQADTGLIAPRIQEPGKPEPEPFRGPLTPMELVRRRLAGYQPPSHPAWVAGMFMLVRREAFARVEGFDERYFMYCEDFDICARLQLAGWKILIARDLSVLHDARRDSHASVRALAWHVSSLLKLWMSPAYRQFVATHEAPRA